MTPMNANRGGESRAKRVSLKGEGEGNFQKVCNGLKLFIGGFLGCRIPFWPEQKLTGFAALVVPPGTNFWPEEQELGYI